MKRKDFSKLTLEVQTEKEQNFEHEEFIAGAPPFLRGISTTMYLQNPIEVFLEIENSAIPLNSEKQIKEALSNTSKISLSTEETTPEIELPTLLIEASKVFKIGSKLGLSTDEIASKISFQLHSKNDTITKIATMRAARFLWANFIQQLNPKNQESLTLYINVNSKNNYQEIIAAILGGAQSITASSEIIDFIESETWITRTVDPFAGSTVLEQLTSAIILKSWDLFQQAH
jgi:methylmalonyl-CoA mutase